MTLQQPAIWQGATSSGMLCCIRKDERELVILITKPSIDEGFF